MLRRFGTVAPLAKFVLLSFAGFILCAAPASNVDAAAPTAGYRDFSFDTLVSTSSSAPTGEKPESKLWWNDGFWWGCLWDPIAQRFSIHRLDLGAQTWVNTGTPVDPRSASRADALWDGTHLYIVSHIFTQIAIKTTPENAGRLYRYSYIPVTRTYSLDVGFPVNVNTSKSETLVLDKDSIGRLWVAWVEAGHVKINRTRGSDLLWGGPYDLPGQGSAVTTDDICSISRMSGGRVGVMWSNQTDKKIYFSYRFDNKDDKKWEAKEVAVADAVLGQVADDHINLKMSADTSGALYAVTKTGLVNPGDPLIYLLRRQSAGGWSRHLVATDGDIYTRPVLSLDKDAGRVYVFAMSDKVERRQAIYMKSASVADLVFPTGVGTPVIASVDDPLINNVTTTKQSVSGETGLLVLASDISTHYYFHNYLDIGQRAPVITSFTPPHGVAGTEVTLNGRNFTGATQVAFNGTAATTFTVDSDTVLRAVVPPGATSGRIRVITSRGPGLSALDFVVLTPPSIASFSPASGPAASVVTITGAHLTGASEVRFDGVASTTFTVDDDGHLRATVPPAAVTGRIRVTNAAGSGESAQDFVVMSTIVLRAVDDSKVRSSSPNNNYGQDSTLRVRNGDPTWRFFTKFVVTGLSGPIQQAKVRLFATDVSDSGGAIHSVSNDYRGTTTPWTENGINWNNAPEIVAAALDSLGRLAANTWVEFDVTAAITGNGTYSFGCRSSTTNSAFYSSDEGINPPQLVIVPASPAPAQSPAASSAARLASQPEIGSVSLRQNQPNPFHEATEVFFDLPVAEPVQLVVYDVRGRVIQKLVDSWQSPGHHAVRWEGRDRAGLRVPSGMYFLRLETPAGVLTRKVLLNR